MPLTWLHLGELWCGQEYVPGLDTVTESAQLSCGCRLVVHGQFDLITLDSYVEGHLEALRQKVGVVKIDVEGFEDKVRGRCSSGQQA